MDVSSPECRAQLRALADAATEGPWTADGYRLDAAAIPDEYGRGLCIDERGMRWVYDAAFIAAAREAVPALLDLVQQLTDQLAEQKELATGLQEQDERNLAEMATMATSTPCHYSMRTEDRCRASQFWERIVNIAVASPGWRPFYEADQRGPADETMIDYLSLGLVAASSGGTP